MSEESQERPTVANGALAALVAELVAYVRRYQHSGAFVRSKQFLAVEKYLEDAVLEAALQQPAEPVCSFAHNQLMGIFNCDFDEGRDDCNVHPGERVQAATEPVCKCEHIAQFYCHDLSKTEVFIGVQNQCQRGLHKFQPAESEPPDA